MGLILTASETEYLLSTRQKMTRPAKFRSLIRVDRSAPPWAESIAVKQLDSFADFIVVQSMGDNLPKATVDATKASQPFYTFAAGYDVFDLEIERARKTGVEIASAKSLANAVRSEQILDAIAFGDWANPAINGLNDAGTPPLPSGGAWTGQGVSGTTILNELHGLANAVEANSMETAAADTIVLSLARFQLLVTTRLGDGTDRTVLEAFKAQNPYIKRILPWNRCATAGVGGVQRAIAFDSLNPLGPAMVIARELTDHEQVRKELGVSIAQSFTTAGVVIEMSETVAYLDGI